MPLRKTVFANNEIYHVFNRSSGSIPIFYNKRACKRFILGMRYYQNVKIPTKLSKFNKLAVTKRNEIFDQLYDKRVFWVEVIAYCLMPTHFHFVLKQRVDGGVKEYVRLISNSYSHYYNTKNDRNGSLFGGRFKAILIENDYQLLHVVRYVHLNPLTSYVVEDLKELTDYEFSSFPEYLGKSQHNICEKKIVTSHFKSLGDYRKFVFNQAEYQQSLERIKHLTFE